MHARTYHVRNVRFAIDVVPLYVTVCLPTGVSCSGSTVGSLPSLFTTPALVSLRDALQRVHSVICSDSPRGHSYLRVLLDVTCSNRLLNTDGSPRFEKVVQRTRWPWLPRDQR